MNIFEDLIEELKDENLLEESIFDLSGTPHERSASGEVDAAAFTTSSSTEPDAVSDQETGSEFFRKQAMEEVASLQMVEHVLSGVEREHLKIPAGGFDDLRVKKSLHTFMQITSEPDDREFIDARQALLTDTESWFTALLKRDKSVSIANLRRFCETSRPVLSSQALMALGKFYRNSPFSEATRAKYDYVMTRLFSREIGQEKRRMLCGRIEMVGHINTLYSKWASLNIYSAPEYADIVREQVAEFSTYAAQAEATGSLDDLLKTDIFERLRGGKEAISELFFAPEITAAVIECNLRIGNRFVELVHLEREGSELDAIEEKYGYTYDQLVSDAAGKTLHLAELLRTPVEPSEDTDEKWVRPERGPAKAPDFERAEVQEPWRLERILNVNKWLLAVTLVIVAASVGMYILADRYESSQATTSVATELNVEGSGLERHVSKVKKTAETLYATTSTDWELLDDNGKKQVLINALKFGSAKGANKVSFKNGSGRTVGFASESRVEIYQQ